MIEKNHISFGSKQRIISLPGRSIQIPVFFYSTVKSLPDALNTRNSFNNAMSLTTRQRRSQPSDPPPSSPTYSKYDKPTSRSDGDGEEERGLGWFVPVFALGMLRYMSATSNIIHDCDEVFNYWEPLHYLLYKSGFQTWEYRYSNIYALFYVLFIFCFYFYV